MAKLLSVAVVAAASVFASAAHVCKHTSPEIQENFALSTQREVRTRMFEGQAAEPESIRIGISYANLVSSKYCNGDGTQKPFIQKSGAPLRDCPDYSIYNPTTMDPILKNYVMPKAKAVIEAAYKVVPLSSLTHNAGDCGPSVDVSGTSSDVDLQIFVTVGVMPVGYEGTMAYAYTCVSSGGRPVSGVVNFNPKYLKWNENFDVFENDELVNTAVHEIHHAMGFSQTNLASVAMSETTTRRGKTVVGVKTPNVLAKAKEFFQCDTLTSVEIEDEGGDGTKHGHWERRIALEELMVGAGGGKLSVLTMAFMEDLGVYTPDYQFAKKMSAGNGAGCGFIDEKCNTDAGGKNTVWYFDSNYRCSPDRKMLTKYTWGPTTESIPSQFMYDDSNPTYASSESGLTDRCPYGIRVTQSECAWEVTSTNNADYASYPGPGARCFETSGLRVDYSSTTVSYNSRCIQARCPFGGTRVEFALDGTWIACPLDGSARSGVETPNGYSGTVNCPEAKYICDEEISSGSSVREAKVSGTSSIAEVSTYSTLTLALIFNGTQWESVLAGENRIAMLNHIRQDIAFFLKTESQRLRIRRITPSSTDVVVVFGLSDTAYSNSILTGAFDPVVGSGSFFNYAPQTYASDSSAASAESPYLALESFYINEPSTESLCGSNLSQEKCVTVIAVVLFAVTLIVLLIIVWCLCLRNPFKRKIKPSHAYKYNSDKI